LDGTWVPFIKAREFNGEVLKEEPKGFNSPSLIHAKRQFYRTRNRLIGEEGFNKAILEGQNWWLRG